MYKKSNDVKCSLASLVIHWQESDIDTGHDNNKQNKNAHTYMSMAISTCLPNKVHKISE